MHTESIPGLIKNLHARYYTCKSPRKLCDKKMDLKKIKFSKLWTDLPAFKGSMLNIDPLFMSETIAAILENTNRF